MIHAGHCFHCGQAIPVGAQECANQECLIEVNALPVWPWSRCAADNIWAFQILTANQWLSLGWLPGLGILLFLIGNMALSGRMINIGLVLIGGWFLNRYLLWLIRNAYNALFIQEPNRAKRQSALTQGLAPTDAQYRKKLDDENDKIRAKGWAVRGQQWLKMTANLAIILIVVSIVLSWGPGNILPWNLKTVALETADAVMKNTTVIKAIKVTKRAMDWDSHKLTYVENTLRHKLDLTFDQFQAVANNPYFQYEMVELAIDSGLRSDQLFNHLQKILKDAAPKISTTDKMVEVKGFFAKVWQGITAAFDYVWTGICNYFQSMRQMHWFILLWLNFLLFHIVGFSIVFCGVSFAFAKGFEAADEIKDVIKERTEEIGERRKEEKESAETPKPRASEMPTPEKRRSILDIAFISGITDVIFDKMLKRFFK